MSTEETGHWSGTVGGIDTATTRTGMADPRITFAVNFLGAPALTLTEMRGYGRRPWQVCRSRSACRSASTTQSG